MSSIACNVEEMRPSPPFSAGLPDKKISVLNYVASEKRLVDVRPASQLEVRPRPEMLATGIVELDAIAGGFPRGCLTEICGPASSGKTSVLLATIAAATQREESCVLIDASDSFDPESGAAARVEFGKLLWIRCGEKLSAISRQLSGKIGADHSFAHGARRATHDFIETRSEHRLSQVLKTADLVLQSGGFGLVALDLAGIPEKFVRRIPLASWFRFQRAVEHTKTVLLVVSEVACAQSCATLVFKLSAVSLQPSAKSSQAKIPAHAQLFERMQLEIELTRSRLERKPPGSVKTNFTTRAVRAGMKGIWMDLRDSFVLSV